MPKTFPTAPAFHDSVGLTKREYFAIMMASSHWSDKDENNFSDIARISVRLADVLIEELSREENEGGQDE